MYEHLETAANPENLKRVVIEPVTRVEGHGKVTIRLNDAGEVEESRLHIVEFRGFERFVQGRPYWEAPVLVQRLCGICPVSHHLAAAKAMDVVVGAGPGDGLTPTAEKMRRLMHYGQIFQSHSLHFFHLASPDLLFGYDAPPEKRNVIGVALANRELATQAGHVVCREDILSLSVGQAVYPDDGRDAEELLAEADRRMYIEKQQQNRHKSRRMHARMKCRVTMELHPEGGAGPILGNLIDISLGGCYIETSAILTTGSEVELIFSIDDGKLQAGGVVVRIDPGSGIGVRFNSMNPEERERMHRILEFVHNTTKFYDNRYFKELLKR